MPFKGLAKGLKKWKEFSKQGKNPFPSKSDDMPVIKSNRLKACYASINT